MKTALLIFLCLFVLPLPARALEVRGQVVDAATGQPLAGVNLVASPERATTTDAAGRFQIGVAAGDSLRVSRVGYETVTLRATGEDLTVRLRLDVLETQEVIVVGGLTRQNLDQIAASVTVLDRRQLSESGGSHLQNVIRAVPNLGWSGGTARPRYFQIRGIGERSQYAGEGPPNFSVGFVVDDVELSGLGPGLLFDMAQLEVFKGPQSTIFGPNAMAGLINMESADPTSVFSRRVDVSMGSDGLARYAATVNLPLGERLAVRAGYQTARADGFRENVFLDADTNRRRESLARLKARYLAPGGLIVLGTLFRVDADNGYDTWAPDNNENLETYSDNPGRDHQTTDALSLRAELPLPRWDAELVSITAYARANLEYSYDSDWGNDDFWRREHAFDPQVEGWRYDFFDRTLRQRDSATQELRLRRDGLLDDGDQAVAGLYVKRLEETDDAAGYLFGGDAADLRSTFEIGGLALYGQYERDLTPSLRLSFNLRADRTRIDYQGATNSGAESVTFEVDQWLVGGRSALTGQLGHGRTVYAAVSRGYRAGGVNQHPYLAAANRPYDPEYILNFETGLRASGPRHAVSLTLFHARRADQQVDLSAQQNPGDPNSFFYFKANAGKGRNSGLELEGSYRLLQDLRLFGSLGYLQTHVEAYTFGIGTGQAQTLGDRAAAHAPQYSLRLGSEYRHPRGLFGRLGLSATDEFYFSDSHDQISDPYRLVDGRVGYRRGGWTVSAWGRNLFDARYAVRGFYFGLEPPEYADTLYLSYGDPRQVGLSLSADF